MTEHIVSAAVQWHGLTVSLPRPARHGDILRMLFDREQRSRGMVTLVGPHEEGFLTNRGEFVDRSAARLIAVNSGQMGSKTGVNERMLFTEDLW